MNCKQLLWTVTKEATETERGEKEHTCTVCGYTQTAEIEKLPVAETNPDTGGGTDDNSQTGDSYVTGLSPVMVAWENTVKDGSAGAGDDSDMLPWVLLASTAVTVGAGTALDAEEKQRIIS